MLYLIYILIGLAFLHFVYEAILAPSFRLNLRFKLFAVRDDLRWLRAEREIPDEIFRSLQNGLNNSIRLLPRTDLATVWRAHRVISRDPKLKSLRDKQWEALQTQLDETTRPLFKRCASLFVSALVVNNGMIVILLLPVAMLTVIGLSLGILTTVSIKSLMDVMLIPENQIDNVVPADYPATI